MKPVLLALTVLSVLAPAHAATPNVVLILANHQNMDLGCYGNTAVQTPNIDKLAARGLKFTKAYAQYPMSGPSRVCLLTGLRAGTLGISGNYRYAPELPKGAYTLPAWLKEQGWLTTKAGRVFQSDDYPTSWADMAPGPTEEAEIPPGTKSVVGVPVRTQDVNGKKETLGGLLVLRSVNIEDADTADGRSARQAIDQIQKAAATKKPFFAAVGFMNPEFRNAVPQAWLDKYKGTPVSEPSPVPKGAPDAARFAGILPERAVTSEERQQFIAGYRAQTAFMDAQVGLVLEAIDQMQLAGNTVVIFASTAGFHLGDHGGLWGMRSLYDQACRVPLIMAGPGITAGQTCARVVELVDVFPTLMEYLRLKSPKVMDGGSFATLLRQPTAPFAEPALTVVLNYGPFSGIALRNEFASYMYWGQNGAELYNLQTDPNELTSLADDKKMAPAMRKMDAELKKIIGRK
ncbi:MAG: sulfatase-like hydrolase/transferase [Prosthecobacter sp.]